MSGVLNSLLSSIDPSAAPKSPAPGRPKTPAAPTPQSAQRPGSTNGAPQTLPLKRKADGQSEGGQVKVQRKEGVRPAGSVRSAADVAKPNISGGSNAIPYRGTAALGGAVNTKSAFATTKKPKTTISTASAVSKTAAVAPKSAGASPTTGAPPTTAKKGSYAAMLQKAKEVQSAKPAPPPIKVEPTKILSKKEREALRTNSNSSSKGKKAVGSNATTSTGPSRIAESKDKRKPAEIGYTGTARPAKKPVEISYKGTAKPASSTPQPTGKAGASASSKGKSKPQARYNGYASWSDLDDEDDVEEDYASDGSSDMEGGMWDVENEEALALRAAKAEDAKALAEENEHKRQKEERKRKLMALNKAAAGKRKF